MVALHIRPGILENLTNIGSRVAHWDRARRVLLDVVLQIALNSLHNCQLNSHFVRQTTK